ncbi:hypothetical protein BH09MYX1_BH09MYX1_46450 [soil metagenome]
MGRARNRRRPHGVSPDVAIDQARFIFAFACALVLGGVTSANAAPNDAGIEASAARPLASVTLDLAALRKRSDPAAIDARLAVVRKAAGAKYFADDFDLASALTTAGDGGTDAGREAFAVLQATFASLRELAAIEAPDAVVEMARVAGDHGFVLQVEVARRIRALDDRAIAGLLLARREPGLRHFATTTLESMGKRVAGDAVQTKDDQALVDILTAFGTLKDPDGLGVVFSFVSTDRPRVRKAAQAAVRMYGDQALPRLRDTYTNLEGKAPPHEWTSDRLASELWRALEADRLADVYALVDEGLKEDAEGKLDLAVASLDKALAKQHAIERRKEMVPVYVRYAQSLEDTDREKAETTYRKAKGLDPGGNHDTQIDGALAYLEGMDLAAKGLADREPFERSLTLDPGNEKARAELARRDDVSRERDHKLTNYAWAGAAAGLFIVLAILFLRRPRRARA